MESCLATIHSDLAANISIFKHIISKPTSTCSH